MLARLISGKPSVFWGPMALAIMNGLLVADADLSADIVCCAGPRPDALNSVQLRSAARRELSMRSRPRGLAFPADDTDCNLHGSGLYSDCTDCVLGAVGSVAFS
jgi:hypothetical protein